MKIIRVEKLEKCFDYYEKGEGMRSSLRNLFYRRTLTRRAVRGISFSLEEGEMVGFLGPNGAGKTTTLKMLSGILYPTSGSAEVLGHVPWKREEDFKKQFSIVMGQKNQLWWDLPAVESFYLNKCIYGLDREDYRRTVESLSEYLNVKELLQVQVRRLSLGERMKMELIAALLNHPKVLFLDEPTIGLDLIAQKNIRDFLQYYNEQHRTTVLLTSHYMKDIEQLCRRTVVINHGEIVYDGALADVNRTLGEKKIIRLKFGGEASRAALEALGALREYDGVGARLEVGRGEIRAVSQALLSRFDVLDINIEDVPLEESIEFLFRKEAAR